MIRKMIANVFVRPLIYSLRLGCGLAWFTMLVVAILFLHTERLGQDPVLFLFQFPVATLHVVCNLRAALVQWIVPGLGKVRVVTLRRQLCSRRIFGLHLHVRKVALVQTRLFHVASLGRGFVGEALKELIGYVFATARLDREILRQPGLAFQGWFRPTK